MTGKSHNYFITLESAGGEVQMNSLLLYDILSGET